MDPSIKLQMDVRNNATAFNDYAKELNDWEQEMKLKDKFLQKTLCTEDLPPIRSKRPKAPKPCVQKCRKSYSTDYSNWDKYDVDKACQDVEESSTESESTEDEEEAMRKGDELKKEGNSFVTKENWDKAIECYTKAIAAYCGDAIYFANRALCYIKKEQWELADRDCCSALELNLNYVKALQRRAVARAAVGRMSEALYDLSKVIKLEPNNKQAKEHIQELKRKMFETKTSTAFMNANKSQTKPSTSKVIQKDNIIKVKKSVSFEQEIEKETTSHPWFSNCDGDGRIVVKPIIKAPHQRSKKPLLRIMVEEIDPIAVVKRSINTLTDVRTTDDISTEKPKKGEENLNTTPTIEKSPEIQENKSVISDDFKLKEDKVCVEEIKSAPAPIKFEMPKTAMHFFSTWKKLKCNMDGRFEYLKNIPGEQFPKLFGTSLESSILSEILCVLRTKFVSNGAPVLRYLQGIKSVPRFSALKMFLSKDDKFALKEIFTHSDKLGEMDRNELENLMTSYDLEF